MSYSIFYQVPRPALYQGSARPKGEASAGRSKLLRAWLRMRGRENSVSFIPQGVQLLSDLR